MPVRESNQDMSLNPVAKLKIPQYSNK